MEFYANINTAGGKLLDATHWNLTKSLVAFKQCLDQSNRMKIGRALRGTPKGGVLDVNITSSVI